MFARSAGKACPGRRKKDEMERNAKNRRRRPSIQITMGRATRLHRLVTLLSEGPIARDALIARLAFGLRTFYRELDLLKRCEIRVEREGSSYRLRATVAEAEARMPFPNPQLSFAEMAELARHPGEAAARLAEIYRAVVEPKVAPARRPRKRPGR
ncbi:hypothetical protein TA3x_004192 [Tundrisphaera sp. TA3]|uniref:hypothetical protein n=1 Tax=Tundrisphaera sp. TA3 TaxID=3435775 RepID=UPI003EC01656